MLTSYILLNLDQQYDVSIVLISISQMRKQRLGSLPQVIHIARILRAGHQTQVVCHTHILIISKGKDLPWDIYEIVIIVNVEKNPVPWYTVFLKVSQLRKTQ